MDCKYVHTYVVWQHFQIILYALYLFHLLTLSRAPCMLGGDADDVQEHLAQQRHSLLCHRPYVGSKVWGLYSSRY